MVADKRDQCGNGLSASALQNQVRVSAKHKAETIMESNNRVPTKESMRLQKAITLSTVRSNFVEKAYDDLPGYFNNNGDWVPPFQGKHFLLL